MAITASFDERAGFGFTACPKPARAPIADSGPSDLWGRQCRVLRLGRSTSLRLTGLSSNQARLLGETDVVAPSNQEADVVRVEVRHASPERRERMVEFGRNSGLRWEAVDGEFEVAGRGFLAVVRQDEDGVRATFWTDAESGAVFTDAVTNFARVVLALCTWPRARVVLHSCATIGRDGRARIFFGPSGAGKSTMGALARADGRVVLSDDLNVLEIDDASGVTTFGFPWTGDFGPRGWDNVASLPVAALFRLEKGETNEVRPLRRSLALSGLATCAPFLNSRPGTSGDLLDRLNLVLDRVPSFVLRFRPESSVWEHVDRESAKS